MALRNVKESTADLKKYREAIDQINQKNKKTDKDYFDLAHYYHLIGFNRINEEAIEANIKSIEMLKKINTPSDLYYQNSGVYYYNLGRKYSKQSHKNKSVQTFLNGIEYLKRTNKLDKDDFILFADLYRNLKELFAEDKDDSSYKLFKVAEYIFNGINLNEHDFSQRMISLISRFDLKEPKSHYNENLLIFLKLIRDTHHQEFFPSRPCLIIFSSRQYFNEFTETIENLEKLSAIFANPTPVLELLDELSTAREERLQSREQDTEITQNSRSSSLLATQNIFNAQNIPTIISAHTGHYIFSPNTSRPGND